MPAHILKLTRECRRNFSLKRETSSQSIKQWSAQSVNRNFLLERQTLTHLSSRKTRMRKHTYTQAKNCSRENVFIRAHYINIMRQVREIINWYETRAEQIIRSRSDRSISLEIAVKGPLVATERLIKLIDQNLTVYIFLWFKRAIPILFVACVYHSATFITLATSRI